MHETTINDNCIAQLAGGIKPWTCNVPYEQQTLPYYTSRHPGRAIHGFRLSKKGNWKPAKDCPSDTVAHSVWYTGMLPNLGESFLFNAHLLARDIMRDGEMPPIRPGGQAVHAFEWYRALVAFPKLYPYALKLVFQTVHQP